METKQILCALIGVLLTQTGLTQDEEVVEETPERFLVEVLAFSYADGPIGAPEQLRRPPPLPPLPEEVPENRDGDLPEVEPVPPVEPVEEEVEEIETIPIEFKNLLSEELELVEAFEKLDTLSAYDVLFHAGWSQEGVPETSALPFDVRLLRAPPELTGDLTLHRSRFLHLAVDLAYEPDGLGPVAASGFAELEDREPFRLKERRRLRSGELHYFDHPAFGLLVMIKPEPEPEPEPEEETEPEVLLESPNQPT